MSPGIFKKEKNVAQFIYKEESERKKKFYLGFYFTLPKTLINTTPAIINIIPAVPNKFGV